MMLRSTYRLSFLVLLISAAWCAAAEPAWIGYRGDGSCVAPASNPPVDFDEKTGRNILWKTPLPYWCYGSPIVVKDRVFVTSEPDADHDFPLLLCLDNASGKILWQRELDAMAMMDQPPGDEVRKAWHDCLTWVRQLNRLRYLCATDAPAAARFAEASGFTIQNDAPVFVKGNRPDVRLARIFNRSHIYFDVFQVLGMGRIGYAFPTPVSDGQFVYVATGLHAFACFDLEGKAKWQKFIPGQNTSNAGYGPNDFCKNARSPLIYQDLLISDAGNLVRGIDKATGELRWSHKVFAGHGEIVTPTVLTTGGRDILLCFGPSAYLLPEGKPLTVEGWPNHGGTMLTDSDQRDVVFFTGGGEHGGWENKGHGDNPPPAAVRFALSGDKLVAKVLWSGVNGENLIKECHTGLVYFDGKLYHPAGCIFDAISGKIVQGAVSRGDAASRATPRTRHLLWIAGGKVYGLREESAGKAKDSPKMGILSVYDTSGKRLAESTLAPPPADGARQERITEACGAASWGFSYSCPFAIFGDRIYIRSNDMLYCIGK